MPPMSFLETLQTFPAILPTIVLGVILIYWVFVILGALDVEFADFDLDVDLDSDANFLHVAGLPGIPTSITLSLLCFVLWLLCVPATYFLAQWIPSGLLQIVLGLGILFVALIVAAQITVWLVKPFRGFFADHSNTHTSENLVGKVCIISTGHVDENFGQATYEDGGAGLILNVRSSTPNLLKRHARALIIEYDVQAHAYTVTDLDDI